MPLQFWFTRSSTDQWLGVVMLLFVAWMRRPAIPLKTTLLIAVSPLICGICYFVMAYHWGWFYLPVSDDPTLQREFYVTRYIDWIFMVPLTLFTFLSIALTDSGERDRELYRLLLPATGMTVSALLFSAAVQPVLKVPLYFAFLGFSVLLALAVARVFQEQAKAENSHFAMLRRDVRFLAGLWACYSLTILFGSDGTRTLLPSVTTACFETLDFALAVAYAFVALSRVGRTREAEARAKRRDGIIRAGSRDAPALASRR